MTFMELNLSQAKEKSKKPTKQMNKMSSILHHQNGSSNLHGDSKLNDYSKSKNYFNGRISKSRLSYPRISFSKSILDVRGHIFVEALTQTTLSFCRETTLHGMKYIVDDIEELGSTFSKQKRLRKLISLTVWTSAVIVGAVFAIVLMGLVWDRFQTTPTITTVETNNYPIWNLPFPAVTICNINKVYAPAAQNITDKFLVILNQHMRHLNVKLMTVRFWAKLKRCINRTNKEHVIGDIITNRFCTNLKLVYEHLKRDLSMSNCMELAINLLNKLAIGGFNFQKVYFEIERLPLEILIMIFDHLPHHRDVSLVNRKFYDAVRLLNDRRIWLKLDASLLNAKKDEGQKVLQSIEETDRIVRNVRVCLTELTESQWSPIITKFSDMITRLELVETTCPNIPNFVQILSSVPNLEHLVVDLDFDQDHETEDIGETVPVSEELNLQKLKKLEVKLCNAELFAVFLRLPRNVLTEMAIIFRRQIKLHYFLRQQKYIKKLRISIAQSNFNETIRIVSLNLSEIESLTVDAVYLTFRIIRAEQMFSKAKKLKYLKWSNLSNARIAEFLPIIPQLEVLTLDVAKFSPSDLNFINKMSCLKSLTLHNCADLTQLEKFARFDNSGLTTLQLDIVSIDMPVELISALAKSAPNLKIFCLLSANAVTKMLEAVMCHFNFIEVLRFFHENPRNHVTTDAVTYLNSTNCRLIELSVTMILPYEISSLMQLFNNYPNLQKLSIGLSKPIAGDVFTTMLIAFENIQSLTLTAGSSKLTVRDLTGIRSDYAKKLKFISLQDSTIKLTESCRRRFQKCFDVCVKKDAKLILAVDTKTMKSELIRDARNVAVFSNEFDLSLL